VQVLSLESGERHVLMQGADTGRYAATGHLVYARQDQLLAVAMDLNRLQTSDASAAALPEFVRDDGEGAAYAISEAGVLAYGAGGAHRNDRRIVWVDHAGHVDPLAVPPRRYDDLSLSPDGRVAAVSINDSTIEIWLYDIARNTFTRLTNGASGSSQAPLWTPDGTHVVYRGTRSGFRNLFWKATDRGGDEERLTTRPDTNQTPQSWSPDGSMLMFDQSGQPGGTDLWMLGLQGNREPRAYIATSANEDQARVSPDGKWLAYRSDESGRPEIYVQPFREPSRRWQISTDGGEDPEWSHDGRDLFYLRLDQLMAVDINSSSGFSAGPPRSLFTGKFPKSPTISHSYAVSPDGRRFPKNQTPSRWPVRVKPLRCPQRQMNLDFHFACRVGVHPQMTPAVTHKPMQRG
jgi:eukaryotic-like serine/threonine-protein kinase